MSSLLSYSSEIKHTRILPLDLSVVKMSVYEIWKNTLLLPYKSNNNNKNKPTPKQTKQNCRCPLKDHCQMVVQGEKKKLYEGEMNSLYHISNTQYT